MHTPHSRSYARLLTIAVCAANFAALAAATQTSWLPPFDQQVVAQLAAARTPLGLAFFTAVTALCAVPLASLTVLLVAVALWRRQKAASTAVILLPLASTAATFLCKALLRRPRPDMALQAVPESWWSFPSAHATVAASLYGLLAYLFLQSRLPLPARLLLAAACVAIAALVCVSRVYLGVHYPSDVLGGALVGIIGVLVARMILEKR